MSKISHLPRITLQNSQMGRFFYLYLFIVLSSCVPRFVIVGHPNLVSSYFQKKISKLEKKDDLTKNQKRTLLKLRLEYAFGVILEESDRLVDEDYSAGISKSNEALSIFRESKLIGTSILSEKYPDFEFWLSEKKDIIFSSEDVVDLYWLGVAYGGAVKSSRGNPFEVVHIPKIGKLLTTAIAIEPDWSKGALYTAMMSYMSTSPEFSNETLKDTIDYYFQKAVTVSDSLDASPFVSYAEIIDKKFQNRKGFEDKLNYVLAMNVNRDKHFRMGNIIAQERAKWLLSRKDEYFYE